MPSVRLVNWRVADVKVEGNDRKTFDEQEIVRLATSIDENGLLHPITVRPDGALVAGERRLRAVRHLKWETVPALVRSVEEEEASRLKLVENINRVDLNPLEEGEAYRSRMEAFDLDEATIAAWANKSVAVVRNRMALLTLREDVQDLVRKGQLGVGLAGELIGLDNNRQGFVLRWLVRQKRPPLVGTLREYADTLRAQQAEENASTLFDVEELMQSAPVPVPAAAGSTSTLLARARALPNADARLPVFGPIDCRSRVRGHYASWLALTDYQRRLIEAGFKPEAEVVGTIIFGLAAQNLLAIPFKEE